MEVLSVGTYRGSGWFPQVHAAVHECSSAADIFLFELFSLLLLKLYINTRSAEVLPSFINFWKAEMSVFEHINCDFVLELKESYSDLLLNRSPSSFH